MQLSMRPRRRRYVELLRHPTSNSFLFFLYLSPSKPPQLPPSQRRIHEPRPRKPNVIPNINPIVPDQLRNWARVIMLRHAQNRAHPADHKRHQRRDPKRQLVLAIPVLPRVAAPPAEDVLLLERDGDPDGDPVAHEGEEVCEDGGEVVAARQGAHGEDDDAEGVPHEARHHLAPAAQDLEVDARRVRRRDHVRDEPQRHDDGADGPEDAQRREGGDDQGAGAGARGGPGGVRGGARGEAAAEQEGEGEGEAERDQGRGEDVARGQQARRAVDEEVGGPGGVGDCGAEADGEEGEAVRGDGAGVADGGDGGVEVWPCDADEDEEHDDLGDDGVALVVVEDADAEGGHEPGDDGDDDDADDDGEGRVRRHGGQHLARDHGVDHAVAQEHDEVQQHAELHGPPAHGVARDDERAVPRDGAPGRHVGDGEAADDAAEDGAEGCVEEAQLEDGLPDHAQGDVLGGRVDAEPEEADLEG